MTFDPAMDDWVNRARAADIWSVLDRLPVPHTLKLRGHKTVGPCPACGGHDRFSMDRRKGIFFCRRSATGGDAIALVQYLTGADFFGAVETITGEAPPRGEHGIKSECEQRVALTRGYLVHPRAETLLMRAMHLGEVR